MGTFSIRTLYALSFWALTTIISGEGETRKASMTFCFIKKSLILIIIVTLWPLVVALDCLPAHSEAPLINYESDLRVASYHFRILQCLVPIYDVKLRPMVVRKPVGRHKSIARTSLHENGLKQAKISDASSCQCSLHLYIKDNLKPWRWICEKSFVHCKFTTIDH